MMRVYVATGKGFEIVSEAPVSQTKVAVASTDMFAAMVYVAEFREHEAITSIADGVFDKLV